MSNNFKPLSEQVAGQFIEEMKNGTSVFQKNDGRPLVMPFNAGTGKAYRGAPAFVLLARQEPDPRWMTLEQGNFRKNNVMKGEKGTLITFFKTREMQPVTENGQPVLKENGKPKMASAKLDEPKMTAAFLFNARQMKDMPDLAEVMAGRLGAPQEERLKAIFENSGIDAGNLSPQEALRAIAEKLIAEKPNESSVKDALKANIASLFISAKLQLPFTLGDHVGYLQAWSQVLKEEPSELFKIANDAQYIADRVTGLEKKRDRERQVSTSLDKGDVIAYKGDTIKVLAILRGNTAQVENSDGAKYKVGPKDGLYAALVAAKNNAAPEQAVVRDMSPPEQNDQEQRYGNGR